MGPPTSLEGFGEAEGKRHPEEAGGSNAGTEWFRAGAVQLVPEDTQFSSHLKAQEATERVAGSQLLISCQ